MYNIQGIIVGFCTFIIIGLFHPIVVKSEYHFGKKVWPAFLIAGIIFIYFSLKVQSSIISPILSVLGFTCLWSIHELFEQEKRVKKGWFPKNPNREYEN